MTSEYHRMDIIQKAIMDARFKGEWDPAYRYLSTRDLRRAGLIEDCVCGANVDVKIVTCSPDSACRIAKSVLAATGRPAGLTIESIEFTSDLPDMPRWNYTYRASMSTKDPTGGNLFDAWFEAGKAEGMIG